MPINNYCFAHSFNFRFKYRRRLPPDSWQLLVVKPPLYHHRSDQRLLSFLWVELRTQAAVYCNLVLLISHSWPRNFVGSRSAVLKSIFGYSSLLERGKVLETAALVERCWVINIARAQYQLLLQLCIKCLKRQGKMERTRNSILWKRKRESFWKMSGTRYVSKFYMCELMVNLPPQLEKFHFCDNTTHAVFWDSNS